MNETVEPNAHFNGGLADVIHSNKPFSNLRPLQPVQPVQPTQQNLVPVAEPTPVQPKIDVSFLDDLL